MWRENHRTMGTTLRITVCCFLLLASCQAADSADQRGSGLKSEGLPDEEAWEEVLSRFHSPGGIDYAGLVQDRTAFDRYIESLAGANIEDWSSQRLIPFWINAYNAVVIKHVLDYYPDIESVRDDHSAPVIRGFILLWCVHPGVAPIFAGNRIGKTFWRSSWPPRPACSSAIPRKGSFWTPRMARSGSRRYSSGMQGISPVGARWLPI